MQPIPNFPALLFKKTLIIADLHIGIEKEFREKGMNILSQTKKMLSEIVGLKNKYKINHIIINGDFKHNIPIASFQELRELPDFVKELNCKIDFIVGNHDGNLKKILKEFDNISVNKELILSKDEKLSEISNELNNANFSKKLTMNENRNLKRKSQNKNLNVNNELTENKIGFFHGHSWAKEIFFCEKIISAHLHPSISLIDEIGIKTNFPCWIRARFSKKAIKFIQKKFKLNKEEEKEFKKNHDEKEITIIPAFNKFCYGRSINLQSKFGILLRNNLIDLPNAEIYLLNGVYLGKLKEVKNVA